MQHFQRPVNDGIFMHETDFKYQDVPVLVHSRVMPYFDSLTLATMMHFDDLEHCLRCGDQIDYRQYIFTKDIFSVAMCGYCEQDFRKRSQSAENPECILYFELLKKGIPATLQHNDGFKTVDIAIESAMMHIEVDGIQHHSADQALTDLERTTYSLEKNIITIRIPNRLVLSRLHDTVKSIHKLYTIRKRTR
jgi:very-short-patch-repair endonuclease